MLSAMDRAMRIALVLWQRVNFACHLVPPDLVARSLGHHRGTKHLSRFLQGQSPDTHSPPKRRAAADLRTEGLQQDWRCRFLNRRQEVARIYYSGLPNRNHFMNSLKRDSSRRAAAESQLAEHMARLVIIIALLMSSLFNPHAA
jgi:hypothetical protein